MDTDQLAAAADAHKRAEHELRFARAHLHVAILDALERGTTQADIVRATGYTRETIRRIAKGAAAAA